jgi:hypothetical protein
MADSANILSVLQMLAPPPGADAPDVQLPGVASNVLQQLPQPAPMPVQAPPPPPPAPAATEAPHRRRSLLDTIGRISDVLAKVGGADALYEPTLNAREDRALKLGDHGRLVDSENVKLATDKFDLGDKQNLRVGQAARGLKAIMTQNPNADVGQAWNALASQMQLDPATAQSFGSIFATHPEEIDGVIASMTDPKYSQSKFGGSVVYGRDAKGNIVAFQPSLGDEPGRNILPDGIQPVDPAHFVDLGGSVAGVGTRSGRITNILPKTEKPGFSGGEPIKEKPGFSGGRPIAPAPGKDGAGAKASDPRAGLKIIADIQQGFDNLHSLKALPGEGSAVGNLLGAVGRTHIGQTIGATTGLSASAQERELLAKNLANLQSDLIKSLPGNATRTKFEQEIQKKRLPDPATMSYATANRAIGQIREAYMTALQSAQTPVARPSSTPARPKAQAGWTIVKVQ